MRWLRRTGVAAVIAAFVVLILPAPAMAARPTPPPVDPLSYKPSAYASTSAASKGSMPTYSAAAKAARGGPTVAGYSLNTPAGDFVRGAGAEAGKRLFGAFSIGFGLGQGGVRVWASQTGNDALPGVCDSGAVMQVAATALYLDLMPDCTMQVDDPNGDISEWPELSYGGFNLSHLGTMKPPGYSYHQVCLRGSMHGVPGVATPTGSKIQTMTYGSSGASWGDGGVSYTGEFSRPCDELGRGANAAGFWHGPSSAGWSARLVSTSTGAVLATMSTPDQNPERQLRCEISFGRANKIAEGMGLKYREGSGIPVSAGGLGCAGAWEKVPDDEDINGISVYSDDVKVTDSQVTNPSGELRLWKKVDGSRKSCLNWQADCVGWWAATNEGTNPGPYVCTFGDEDVDLVECSVYRYTFDNRDGGCPKITEPSTGEGVAWFCGKDGNSTDPDDTPTPGEDCFEEWSDTANPIEWVMKPIQCGLISLLIPRADVVAQAFDAATGKWDQTMPGQIGDVVGTVFVPPDVVSGCSGPTIVLPLSVINESIPDYEGTPLSACDEPMDAFAAMSRLISGAIMVFVTGLGIVRRASSVVNAEGLG